MEKVWEELKKIEAQAEQIRSEAEQKAQSITALAQQNSEKLIANGQAYAEEEGRQLLADAVKEANRQRSAQLHTNQAETETLKMQAEKRTERVVAKIVNAVIKEA